MSLDEYTSTLLNNTYNWLTVIDVFRSDSLSRVVCKCKCTCGNIAIIEAKNILSGRRISCGCYRYSKEKSEKYKQWCKNNPDKIAEAGRKISEWYKNNPGKVAEKAARFSQWCKDNPDKVRDIGKAVSKWYSENRDSVKIKSENTSKLFTDDEFVKSRSEAYKRTRDRNRSLNVNFEELTKVIHDDYLDDLISGKLNSGSRIKTKCPVCGEFDEHLLNNVFVLKSGALKHYRAPLCSRCVNKQITSSYEQEISDYISTFYSGECIKNDRSVINGKELDLYYPEKKIAIEFNGDYWHDENHKPKDYHYNKFKTCRESNILLVSIFETEWKKRNEDIKEYILDLFRGKENNLSFNEDRYLMNNNYPSPSYKCDANDNHIDHYYATRESKVYTCGFSLIVN
jgi:hypothetical protein